MEEKRIVNDDFEDLASICKKAWECNDIGAYATVLLLCRKIMSRIAVGKGASQDKTLIENIKFLDENNYLPPITNPWIEYARGKGNRTDPEPLFISEIDVTYLLEFCEALINHFGSISNDGSAPRIN